MRRREGKGCEVTQASSPCSGEEAEGVHAGVGVVLPAVPSFEWRWKGEGALCLWLGPWHKSIAFSSRWVDGSGSSNAGSLRLLLAGKE